MMGSILCLVMFLMGLGTTMWGLFVLDGGGSYSIEWEMGSLNGLGLNILFFFDWMSISFMGIVFIISASVLSYTSYYMMMDSHIGRFLMLVLLFIVSMLLFIMGGSSLSLLLGWDGLGLISYCLVMYYNTSKSVSAGMLTILSNRVGDIGLLLMIAWLFSYGTWGVTSLYYMNNMELYFVLGLVVLAGVSSSAQIPFSAWLPAAMAAPTPVSALVHSSTLVTAGIYLLIRFNYLYESIYEVSLILLVISLVTMVVAGLGAVVETDLKRVIALSTLSQLGMMLFVLSCGGVNLAFFHLLTHALFSALLFLCAGKIIHDFNGAQDIRGFGGVMKFNPVVGGCFLVANFSLCGVPFMAGFYSKDLLLENMVLSGYGSIILVLVWVICGLTSMYSVRVGFKVFLSGVSVFSVMGIQDKGKMYMVPLIGLSALVIMFGSAGGWLTGLVTDWEYLGVWESILPMLVLVMGVIMGLISEVIKMNKMILSMSLWSSLMFLEVLSTQWFTSSLLDEGEVQFKIVDNGWFEYIGGVGVFSLLMKGSILISLMQYKTVSVVILSGFGLVLSYSLLLMAI